MEKESLSSSLKDHKAIYRNIRNFLAGRFLGATRDETLLEEFTKCLFCKVRILRSGVSSQSNDSLTINKLYRRIFVEIKSQLKGILREDDEIILDPASVAFINEQLGSIDLLSLNRDPIGDAYETFIGSAIRGQDGQFFTARNAVKLLVRLVNPQPTEKVIDPACGTGSFLNETARHLVSSGASIDEADDCIYGIDKDSYLVRLARLHLAILSGHVPQIYCADSLAWRNNENEFPLKDTLGVYDVVLTNPPFGSKIVAASDKVKKRFALGYRWRKRRNNTELERSDILQPKSPPQVLFVERCISLVKPGGRIGMVIPESLISSNTYRYVRQFIRNHADIRAVIGMPEALFKTSGKGGTHTKTCLLYFVKKGTKKSARKHIFMAEAKWCGHDSRGKPIDRDDLPKIAEKYWTWKSKKVVPPSNLGYIISDEEIINGILTPRYYNPEILSELGRLRASHQLVRMGDLVKKGIISIATGDEVGKLAYDSGPIPFIRTSDISNWEIKVDPKQRVSVEIYNSLKGKQDVRSNDILMVKDGTYLIGTCALVTPQNTRMLYQSHLYKLRVGKNSLGITPYLLLALLNSRIVRKQILSKRFTQDIIDSLGQRILELILPVPANRDKKERISEMVNRAIHLKSQAREVALTACKAVEES